MVDMDTYYIMVGRKRFKVLALMDEHTRYEVDQVIGRETSGNVVKGLWSIQTIFYFCFLIIGGKVSFTNIILLCAEANREEEEVE